MFEISKYIPQINSYCFRAINKMRAKVNLSALPDYKLLTKVPKSNISQLDKGKYWVIPKDAVSYDYILIGKKTDLDFTREILSCYDSEGRVISRCYRDNGVNTKLRKYDYNGTTRIISQYTFDTSRIDDAWEKKDIMNIGGIWKKIFSEFQYIKKYQNFDKDGKVPIQLSTKRIEPVFENSRRFTFVQYPMSNVADKRSKKRVFGTLFTKIKGGYELSEISKSNNFYLDFRDRFLPFRILNPHTEEGLIALTRRFLKDVGLESFNIGVIPNSEMVAKNSEAHFTVSRKEICYAPKVIKSYILSLVNTARHETEHAWQYFMIGRLGKGKSNYETEALERFGPLKNVEDIKEAVKLSIAREKYPKLSDTENLAENIDYKTNYMEVKAKEKALDAEEEYAESADNFYFFEQFN